MQLKPLPAMVFASYISLNNRKIIHRQVFDLPAGQYATRHDSLNPMLVNKEVCLPEEHVFPPEGTSVIILQNNGKELFSNDVLHHPYHPQKRRVNDPPYLSPGIWSDNRIQR